MVVIRPIVSQQGLGGAPQASVQIDNSIGESLQRAGNSLENAASARLEMQNRETRMVAQNEEFRANQQFEQFSESLGVDYQDAKTKLDPSGQGLTTSFLKKFDEKSSQFLQTVPANLRPKFEELARTGRAAWMDKSAQEEVTQRQSWFRTGIKDKTDKLTTQVFENPAVFGDAYQDGLRTIQASGLPEVEKAELTKAWQNSLTITKAESYIRSNPARIAGPQSPQLNGLARAVIGVESSGDPIAESNKGASGLMQVMPETAAEIAREIGDVNFPKSLAEQKAYLKSPAVSIRYGSHYLNKMLNRYNGDLEASLIAYNGGPQRADAWLNAGRDDSVIPMESRDYYKKVIGKYQPGGAMPKGQDMPLVVGSAPGIGRLSKPDVSGVNPVVMERFKQLQNTLGVSIPIVSGFRDADRNKKAGGADNSQHIHGNALDLDVSGMSKAERLNVIRAASAMGFTGIGVYQNSIHVDNGPRRSWGPTHHDDSVPAWAKEAVGEHLAGSAKVVTSGNSVYLDPEFESLPLDERLKIYDRASKAVEDQNTQRIALEKANQATIYDGLTLGIQTGELNSEQTILGNQQIDDGQKATLLKALKTKRDEDGFTLESLAAYANGQLKVDPYSTDGKKIVDGVQKRISQTVPAEQQQMATESLISQTGVVPQSTLNNLRAGLDSQNAAEVEAAAQQAARISTINPAALSRRDGGSEVQKRADDFNHFVNNLNMTPQQAAQRIADMNDPEKQRDRKALEPAAKEFIKQIEGDDLGDVFDESWAPFSDPDIGFTEGQALGIQAEYQAIAQEQFYQANGNVDVAKNRAKEEMKRLYGVTNLTGRSVVMKHPPERYWPADTSSEGAMFGIGADPLGYAKTQLYRELVERDADFDPNSVQFVTTPATEQMIKRGEMPGYSVFYTDKDGVVQTFPGQLWRPDFKPAQRAMQNRQQQRVEDAVAADEFQRGRVIPGQDREQSLDNFLDGDPMTGQVKPVVPSTPETTQGNIDTQRQDLLNNARNSGLLTGGGGGY